MNVITFIQVTSLTFLLLLALIILYQMLTGKIHTYGILRDKHDGNFSVGRLQAFIATFIVAGSYLLNIQFDSHTNSLPPVPEGLLIIMGGSYSLYLIGKLRSVIHNKSKVNFDNFS